MVAALLHDVGHGPFSHAFEKLFDDHFEKALDGDRKKISKCKISHDEDWLKKFIAEFKFNHGISKKDIKNILFSKKKSYLSDIISSQLDADRMDYLLRDSHFCGVPYGEIDLKWIISSTKIIKSDKTERLGINKKGIGALEHYIIARRLMTRNIYYHKKIKAAEYYIRQFLHALIEQNDTQVMKNTTIGKFLIEYKKYSELVVKIKENDKIEKKKEQFINKSFKYYSKITDDDIWYIIKKYGSIKKNKKHFIIARNLIKRSLPNCYALDPSRIDKSKLIVELFCKKLKKSDQWKIYIDKLDFISYKSDKEPIYIKEGDTARDVLNSSIFLNLLSDRGEASHYLYLDKSINNLRTKILNELKESYCLLEPDEKIP